MPTAADARLVGRLRARALWETLRASLWFVPTVFVSLAVTAAVVLNRVRIEKGSALGSLGFPGGADGARAILQAIAGSVITVTGVVFSLTVVTLQLASTQFSPRLLRTFLRDLSNQVVLGTFLATFAFSLVALRAVVSGSVPAEDRVPELSITGAYVLAVASVVALVYFIDHIARSIRIDSLMREVNEDTLVVLDRLHPLPPPGEKAEAPEPLPEPPPDAAPIVATRSGFLQAVEHRLLLRAAAEADVLVRVEPTVGDRVIEGSPVLWVWGLPERSSVPPALSDAAADALLIGYERTMQQDVAFGLRQLVDVAVKALSPGVNDPTTAEHAIGHLAALLTTIARRPIGPVIRRDEGGSVRVVVRVNGLPEYLDLACGQIRRYGAAEPSVMRQLLRMLLDVANCDLAPFQASAVRREARLVLAAAERSTAEPLDLDVVRALHRRVNETLDCAQAES